MKKPRIGVTPLYDTKRQSFWMLPGYMRGIEAAGGSPVVLSMTADEQALFAWAEELDGFLLTGGQDVSPSLYGEKALPQTGELCPEKDHMEGLLLEKALQFNKPVLGICRGLQFLNAYLGGSLYQDIPTQLEGAGAHSQLPPYGRPSHPVEVFCGTPLFGWLKCDSIQVNSLHHQGVKKLAALLKPAAQSPDGLVEAAFMPEMRFVWGVQWHPEYNFEQDKYSRTLFDVFIRFAGNQ